MPADDLGGEVTVADAVIAKLAGQGGAAHVRSRRHCAAHASAVSAVCCRDSFTEGVEIDAHESHADIGLHVVIERGLNLAEVTRTLEDQVRFEVERIAGVRVGQVSVRVEDVRR